MAYTNIVVGTDGSATASIAVHQAAELAVSCGARLIIVTAYDTESAEDSRRNEQAPADVRWNLSHAAEADRIAGDARERARGLGVARIVLRAEPGTPADAILDAAREFDADCVVVGSVGLTSSARFLLGSVANDVAHHAPSDVLVVETHRGN